MQSLLILCANVSCIARYVWHEKNLCDTNMWDWYLTCIIHLLVHKSVALRYANIKI